MAGKTRGRKPAWDTKVEPRLLEIAAWARNGHIDKKIYEALGINADTFYKYKREKVELFEALRVNKAIADHTVENSSYLRANGFEYNETVVDIKRGVDGNEISRQEKTTTKYALPDTSAQQYWLRNRMSDTWRDKQHIETSVNMEITDTRTPKQILTEAKIPLPQFMTPNITDVPSNTPTETPEAPLQIPAPPGHLPAPHRDTPGQDIEISRLKAQLASQCRLIEELQKKDEIKFVSTDDPENVNSPFGVK